MLKHVYQIGGSISIGLALAGVFLPVLPTTPFVLLAIYLFGKSQPERINEIIQHPKLGPFVKDYLDPQGIPLNSKIKALTVLWISIFITVYFFIPIFVIKALIISIASIVSIFIVTRPSKG